MKKTGLITLLAVLLLITIVVGSIVAGTYARYATTVATTATATAATWTFAAGYDDGGAGISETTTIDLATTLTGTYPNLGANKIAPGTEGEIPIVIDCNGSEVGVKLTITMQATGANPLPAGFSLGTLDSTFITLGETTTVGGVTTAIAYIEKADVADGITITAPWIWAIGDDAAATTGINNDDSGDTYSINVTIRGEQWIGAIPTP